MTKRSADITSFAIQKPHAPLPAERQEKPKPQTRTLIKKSMQVTPEAARQLAMLKAESGRKESELVAEALNLLFSKHDKPQLA
jgi:hypothetical protein